MPYLGQFLKDFSYFEMNGLLSAQDKQTMDEIFNKMRINNTYLKIYNPKYYNALYSITKTNAEIEVLAEQYEAECRVINNKAQDKEASFSWDLVAENLAKLNEIVDNITKLFSTNYFNMFDTVYGPASIQARKAADTTPYWFGDGSEPD